MKTVFTITATLNAGSLCRVIYLFIYLLTLQPFIHNQCRRKRFLNGGWLKTRAQGPNRTSQTLDYRGIF
jgi:hypothetical protein